MFEDGNLWPDAFRIKWFSLVVFEKEFFLVWQGQYFFGNVLSVLFSISGGSETNLKSSWFCQMNFNFNFNLVERWNSFIVNWFNPPTHKPLNKIFNWFLSVQIYWRKQLKYLQENIDLAAVKKFLSIEDQSKSPNSKSIRSQITILKQLKKKIIRSLISGPNLVTKMNVQWVNTFLEIIVMIFLEFFFIKVVWFSFVEFPWYYRYLM